MYCETFQLYLMVLYVIGFDILYKEGSFAVSIFKIVHSSRRSPLYFSIIFFSQLDVTIKLLFLDSLVCKRDCLCLTARIRNLRFSRQKKLVTIETQSFRCPKSYSILNWGWIPSEIGFAKSLVLARTGIVLSRISWIWCQSLVTLRPKLWRQSTLLEYSVIFPV